MPDSSKHWDFSLDIPYAATIFVTILQTFVYIWKVEFISVPPASLTPVLPPVSSVACTASSHRPLGTS